jgi:NAD(P)-dependent dehydrogenase (short-subunit alcohol dehydrogenase family)
MNTMDRFSLADRVAVVTGAARGLGAGFARALGDAGAAVVLVGRDAKAADGVLDSLRGNDIRADFVRADVTVAADVQRVLDATLATHGRVDVLVNNAGACVHAPALDVTPEDWRAVMDVNLDAVWTCSQTFGRHFVTQGAGSIINIGSMSGFIVNRPQWQPAYNASKAAVHHLTRSLAAEWAPHGVRVNALAPGYIKTDMSPVDDPKFRQHWIDDAPMQRYGTVEELAPAVIFLASDASSFITGSVLVADCVRDAAFRSDHGRTGDGVALAQCDLFLGRDPAQVQEAEQCEHEHRGGSGEGGPGGIHRDGAHGAEGVGVQQEAAEGLTLEGELDQALGLGVVRVGPRSRAELRVRPASGRLVEVDLDVVVGVGLGLRTGGELLPGVLLEVRLDLRVVELLRAGLREVDPLGHELGVDVVGHEAAGPGHEPADDQQDRGHDETTGGEQGVECASSHGG